MGSPTCAGLCPAGYACAGAGVADPVLCPTGTYCPAGSATPLPCSEGTYGAAEGLGSADECTPCPRGSYCSAGQRNAWADLLEGLVPDALRRAAAEHAPLRASLPPDFFAHLGVAHDDGEDADDGGREDEEEEDDDDDADAARALSLIHI